MCGIFGVIGRFALTNNDLKYLKSSFIAGTVRGRDGSGIILGEMNGGITYTKSAQNGSDFIENCYDPSWEKAPIQSAIGHNRSATVGDITDDTSHPFNEGSTIGVHNGTLYQGWQHTLEADKRVKVDSQALMAAIDKKGIEWTIKRASGALALVWSDTTDNRTYVYRNDQRPLHYTKTLSGKVYYASEAGMLTWMMKRHHIDPAEIVSFKSGVLYEITNGDITEVAELESPNDWAQSFHNGGTYNSHRVVGSTMAPVVNNVIPLGHEGGAGKADTASTGSLSKCTNGAYKNSNQSYSGWEVSNADIKKGIVGEFIERGNDVYQCHTCLRNINWDFLEGEFHPDIKIHEGCLGDFQPTPYHDGEFIRIKREIS